MDFAEIDSMRLSPRAKGGSAVEPIHVVVKGAVGLMREIVMQAVASQPDMRLMGDGASEPAETPASSGDGNPDVVVLLLHGSTDSSVETAIEQQVPAPAVVAVDTLAQSLWLYDYELYRSNRIEGDFAPHVVVRAIRAAYSRLRRH